MITGRWQCIHGCGGNHGELSNGLKHDSLLAQSAQTDPILLPNKTTHVVLVHQAHGMAKSLQLARPSGSIVDRCLFYNLSCMHTYPFEAHNGALISYGPAAIENNSGAAEYIDRILKGAKVADLPFQEAKDYKRRYYV